MKNGDISNKPQPTIFVRMDDTIFHHVPKQTIVNTLRKAVGLDLTTDLALIPKALSFMSHIVYRTEYNINLVFLEEEDKHFRNKRDLVKESLLSVNMLVLDRDRLNALLDYLECNLVDNNCCRDKIYTLDEAIHLFR